MDFAAASTHLETADLLLCFTGGVTEAPNPANGQFGGQGLLEAVGTTRSALETVT